MMIPVGNKLIVEIINSDEDDWNPLYKILTKAKVLDLGNEVLEYIKKDSINLYTAKCLSCKNL